MLESCGCDARAFWFAVAVCTASFAALAVITPPGAIGQAGPSPDPITLPWGNTIDTNAPPEKVGLPWGNTIDPNAPPETVTVGENTIDTRTVDPLAPGRAENVPSIQQPDRSRLPVFDTITAGGGYLMPRGQAPGPDQCSFQPTTRPVGVAVGGGRVYVAHLSTYCSAAFGPEPSGYASVEMFDAKTLAYLGSWRQKTRDGGSGGGAGIAYYRGEVFVTDTPDAEINVYSDSGSYRRSFSTDIPAYWTDGLFQVDSESLTKLTPVGLDVAWGEVWVELQAGRYCDDDTWPSVFGDHIYAPQDGDEPPPHCALIGVYDAETGALKALLPHAARYGCPLGSSAGASADASQCSGTVIADSQCSVDDVAWCTEEHVRGPKYVYRDLAATPELSGVWAQCRLIARNPLLTALSTDDLLTPDSVGDCPQSRYMEGMDAVWGMNWLLSSSGGPYPGGSGAGAYITEYDTRPNPGTPSQQRLTVARRWQPKDYESWRSFKYRDVAYQNREPRIDWAGVPTGGDWQHGTQCLRYLVSDADIFVVGWRGEHWFELARNFSSIELKLDGQAFNPPITSTQPNGELCMNENAIPSGVHTLTAVAVADGKTITESNPTLRIDNTAPSGSLDGLPTFVRQTVNVTGSFGDAHSGASSAYVETQRPGENTWSSPCSGQNPNAAGRFSCSWNTTSGPDGIYRVRARLLDRTVHGGANIAYTPEITTTVDNTPPSLSDPAPAVGTVNNDSFDHNVGDVLLVQTDAGSGVDTTAVEYNSATDGSATGQWLPANSEPLRGEGEVVGSWDTTGIAHGLHRVRATSRDRAGNQRVAQWQTVFSSQRDQCDRSAQGFSRCYGGQSIFELNSQGDQRIANGLKAVIRTPDYVPSGPGFTLNSLNLQGPRKGIEVTTTNNNCPDQPDFGASSWYTSAQYQNPKGTVVASPCYEAIPTSTEGRYRVAIDRARRFASVSINGQVRGIVGDETRYEIGKKSINTNAYGETDVYGRAIGGSFSGIQYFSRVHNRWRAPQEFERVDTRPGYHSEYFGASNDGHATDGNLAYFCVHGPEPNPGCTPPTP